MAGAEVVNPPTYLPNDTEKLYYGQITPQDAVLGYISRFLEVNQGLNPLNCQIARPAIGIDLASQEILRKAKVIPVIDAQQPSPLPIILVADGAEINLEKPIFISSPKPGKQHNITKGVPPQLNISLDQALPFFPTENSRIDFSVWNEQGFCFLFPGNTASSPAALPFGPVTGEQEAVLLLTARKKNGETALLGQSLLLPRGLLETALPAKQLPTPELPVENRKMPPPMQRVVYELSQEMTRAGLLPSGEKIDSRKISYQEYPVPNHFLDLKGDGSYPLSFIIVSNPEEMTDKPQIGFKLTKTKLNSGKTLRKIKLDLKQMFAGLPPEPEFTVFDGPFLKLHHQPGSDIRCYKKSIPVNSQDGNLRKGSVLLVWQDRILHISGMVLPTDIIDKAFK